MPEKTNQKQITNLYDRIKVPFPISVETENLNRGIDNYHIDVRISETYTSLVRAIVDSQLKLAVAGKKLIAKTDEMERLRSIYADIMDVALHRTKTDITPETLAILQFGLPKFVIQEVRRQLDQLLQQQEDALAQQRQAGAKTMLATQEGLVRFRQMYSEYAYKVCRVIFRQLQREETNELRALRGEYLDDILPQSEVLLFNPLLCTKDMEDPLLLVECYTHWPDGNKGFLKLNASLENFFTKQLRKLKVQNLRVERKGLVAQSEVHDVFGGLFAVQEILGVPEGSQHSISEKFCWLEEPGNIRILFDSGYHQGSMEKIRAEQGFFAARRFKGQAAKLVKISKGLRKALGSDTDIKRMYAGYLLRSAWAEKHSQYLDLELANNYIIGVDKKKILAEIDQTQDGALALVKTLDQLSDYLDKKFKTEIDDKIIQMVTDWSRYRLHLKCSRFAHRVFSRINVLTNAEQIKLSREAGHLHELVDEKEYKSGDNKVAEIIRHTILKADVRGSTTVTSELIKNNLNPASYFSQRFFEPINGLLPTFGAGKVFIEGDAVILSFYEHHNNPQQWYAVARACGMAKGMIDIVGSRNAHARQMKLPLLEIGIGICFANSKPLFLYDEQKPIMISSAIGDADRMSSSSWKLREVLQTGGFNVDVLEIAKSDRQRGEKGQEHIRYNVNGVLLDKMAFNKLKTEIKLKRLSLKIGGKAVVLFVGSYPDVEGKLRELVVREGKVRVWENDKIVDGSETGEVFHEIVTNPKLNAQVSSMLKKARTA